MPGSSLTASAAASPSPEDIEYFDEDERFIIAFDIGNTSSSVTLTHLTWASRPLSPSSSTLRTVLTYPFSTPSLTPVPSRTPSMIAYDRADRSRAFGAECLTTSGCTHAREEGWIVVKGWKDQMRPAPPSAAVARQNAADEPGKKLLKKLRPQLSSTSSATPATYLVPPTSPAAASFPSLASARNSLRSLSSEGLLDAVTAEPHIDEQSTATKRISIPVGGIDGGSGALGDLGRGHAPRSKDKDKKAQRVHHGPRLRDIYADYLKWIVACARAWFAETTPGGDEAFVRCWERARFVFAIPAYWTAAETDLVSGAMELARLLPANFEVGRLNGYTVSAVTPRLRLRAYEPVSRVPAGAGAVLAALSDLLMTRLARTKFKAPSNLTHVLDEFRNKVLTRFAGLDGPDEFRLRIVSEGKGDGKIEKALDSGARIRDGWLTLSSQDVESCSRPAADAIIVRLSSIIPRGAAKHILLSGGFAESPYLVARLRETFEPQGIKLVIPDIPTHAAVSEGALRFYLSETLAPRRTRFALGVQVAVDWATQWEKGMHEREVIEGSGGRRLVKGKWGGIVPLDAVLSTAATWRKAFNFRYRIAANDPTFTTQLWRYDAAGDEVRDSWVVSPDGARRPAYSEVCEVTADLSALVAASEVRGEGEKAWVQLQVELVVYVGKATLEAAVEWLEGDKTVRGPVTEVPQNAF